MQVQPLLWAFGIVKISCPVSGVKDLIPSFQHEIILVPSLENVTDVAVKLRTTIRSSSSRFINDHKRIISCSAVAKTYGKLLKM